MGFWNVLVLSNAVLITMILVSILPSGESLKLGEVMKPPEVKYKRVSHTWKKLVADAVPTKRTHPIGWGIKTVPIFCPEDSYIWGYALTFDSFTGYVDAINRFEIFCHPVTDQSFQHQEATRLRPPFNITYNSPGYTTKFDEEIQICEGHNGPMTAFFAVAQNSPQQGFRNNGLINYQGICWDGRILAQSKKYHDYLQFKQNVTGKCETGWAFCGFQVQYQLEGTSTQDVQKSVVDVEPYCCQVLDAIDECTLQQNYRIVARVDNRESPHPTSRTYTMTASINLNKRVAKTETRTWTQTRSQTVTISKIMNRLQTASTSTTDRRFDPEPSVFGIFEGFGNLVSGFTGLVKRGIGNFLGATGLGELFGIGSGLPKLIGQTGIENALKLGDDGMDAFFSQVGFGATLRAPPLTSLLENLPNLASDRGNLGKLWAFQGIAKSLPHFQNYSWTPYKDPEIMNQVIRGGNSNSSSTGRNLLSFPDITLKDLIGIYGMINLYGKTAVEILLRSGELEKAFNIGNLKEKSWGQGLGFIADSKNLGKIFNVFSMGSIFGASEQDDILPELEKILGGKLKMDDGIWTTEPLSFLTDEQRIDFLLIFYITNYILDTSDMAGSGDMAKDLLEMTGLKEILIQAGESKPERLFNDQRLKDWFKEIEPFLAQSYLSKLVPLVGLVDMGPGLGAVLGNRRFKKSIGGAKFTQLIGSSNVTKEKDITHLAKMYGLKQIFGDKAVDAPETPTNSSRVEAVDSDQNFGAIFTFFTVGRTLSFPSLRALTGSGPPRLSSIQRSDTQIGGRAGISDMFKQGTDAVKDWLGGGELFTKLFGAGDTPKENIPSYERTQGEKRALEEEVSKTSVSTAERSQSLTQSLVEELTIAEGDTKTITINDVFQAKALTLVLAPVISCSSVYEVDISNRRSHVTIVIQAVDSCDIEEIYSVVDVFDYLNIANRENRSFLVEVGSTWTPLSQYPEGSNIVKIIETLDPTAGIRERVALYEMRELAGMAVEESDKGQPLPPPPPPVGGIPPDGGQGDGGPPPDGGQGDGGPPPDGGQGDGGPPPAGRSARGGTPPSGGPSGVTAEKKVLNTTAAENLVVRRIIQKDLGVNQVWSSPAVYEGEATMWEYNYNILLQLKLRCHSVVTQSSEIIQVRLPKVFQCTPKGSWRPLSFNPPQGNNSALVNATVGLTRGGADVNRLIRAQKIIPEIHSQLLRMADELKGVFEGPDVGGVDDVKWAQDTSLLYNIGWSKGVAQRMEIDLIIPAGQENVVVYQLVAKCGPVELNLHKYKVEVKGALLKKIPPDNILEAATGGEEEECSSHLGC